MTHRPATSPFDKMPGEGLAIVLAFPVPRSDVGLVQGLHAGRFEAVDALCNRYGPELLRVAMRVLGPEAPLEELVSESVSRALGCLGQLEEPRELRHWLLSHLVRGLREQLRRARWQRRVAMLMPSRVSARSRDRAGVSTCSEGQRDAYLRLERLGDAERLVLCLTRFDGMEPSEVATVLGTSVARVRGLLERAELRFGAER